MTLAEIIADLIGSVADLVPRITPRPLANEWLVIDSPFGVRVTRWPAVTVPAIAAAERYPACSVPVDPGPQTVTTADGHPVTVNVTFAVRIEDPVLLRETWSHEDWTSGIAIMVRRAVADAASGHNLTHLLDSHRFLIHESLDHELSYCGVRLESLVFDDFVKVRCYRLFTSAQESSVSF